MNNNKDAMNELLAIEAATQLLFESSRKLRLKLAGDSSPANSKKKKKEIEAEKMAAFKVNYIARKLKNFEMAKKREAAKNNS